MLQISLKPPYPPRNAVGALRKQVMEHLLTARPSVGTRMWTDEEMVQMTRLSRSTVRRAFNQLQDEGWIQRRAGSGTYVGPRVSEAVGGRLGLTGEMDMDHVIPSARRDPRNGLLRLAVLIFGIGDLAHDWYTPLVLEGISEAADEQRISVELLGNRDRDINAISRRLTELRPDVLACLGRDPQQAYVIRDAQRLGIPCLLSGTPHTNLDLPAVVEDNAQGMRLAVEHLIAKGHRRISLVMQWTMEPWFVQRYDSFLATLAAAGIEPDQRLIHLLPMAPTPDQPAVESTREFIKKQKPSAVICGSSLAMLAVDRLHTGGAVQVPDDLSLVTFEQDFERGRWLGGVRPTAIRLPLREMGRHLAGMARQSVQPDASVVQDSQITFECHLSEGQTVKEIRS